MKRKINALTAVLLCMVATTLAQTSVTLGTFGYARVQKPSGYHIAGMQFDNSTNTPTTVYSTNLTAGAQIYTWNGTSYTSAAYGPVFVPGQGLVTKWDAEPVLGAGSGYWVQSPSVVDTTLSGNVPMDDAITNSLSMGFQLLSFPYPVDRVVTNLGFTPTSGDQIYIWNGNGYSSSSYGLVFVPGTGLVTKWDNEVLPIAVGQGFWYQSSVTTNWVAFRPYPKN